MISDLRVLSINLLYYMQYLNTLPSLQLNRWFEPPKKTIKKPTLTWVFTCTRRKDKAGSMLDLSRLDIVYQLGDVVHLDCSLFSVMCI